MRLQVFVAYTIFLLAVGLWSLTGPADLMTWILEAAPVGIALLILGATRRRFPLTPISYALIAIHALILLVGARWTYAEVPLGFWIQDLLDFQRNPYDRIGHLAQGFVPAIIARELLRRCTPLRPGAWLSTLVVCVALAISACYELIEWWVALLSATGAEAFLGTQGDVWDTQWDLFCALLGALAALLLLGRWHERQLAVLEPRATVAS